MACGRKHPFCPERLSRNEKISCCGGGRMSCRACCPPTGDAGRPGEERDKDRCTPIQGLQTGLRVAGERAVQGPEIGQSLFEDHCQICQGLWRARSEEHTSELQSLMRISYAVFCLKKKKNNTIQ